MSKIQRIKNQAIANMSHTDMGLVIDVLECYLPEILLLDVQVMTHNERGVKDTVLWVEGLEYLKAVPILEKMADVVRQRDPYKIITVDGARAMFGLPPIQTATPPWSKKMAAIIRHFLLRRIAE
ncbi:hypothetical protein [Acidithiobacillus ferrivorans]|uniref:Uncharacterized protein n=1 Tax=Acidithiobacillus ferrivorans TaxID=160808 RepID=A0A7T5BH41_9PROT|nr:hypothetical protein [Acidithiobacillus ferrivorans]QQD72984.1 hypothetical protein H2515_01190 [Acidithiobacillus ferrivorans]